MSRWPDNAQGELTMFGELRRDQQRVRVCIDGPKLGDTTREESPQQEFWREQPSLDSAILDLGVRVIDVWSAT